MYTLMISALVGVERSASRHDRFNPREKDLGTHFIGGWVDRRIGLNNAEGRKIFPLLRVELRRLGRLTSRYTYCANLTPLHRTYIRVKLLSNFRRKWRYILTIRNQVQPKELLSF
jgi:hypothetical protein